MAKTPEIGQRIAGRLRVLGYWKNGKPDVMRFALDHRYPSSYVYRWLEGQTPRGPVLARLADDLKIDLKTLLGVEPKNGRKALRALAVALTIGGVLGLTSPAAAGMCTDSQPISDLSRRIMSTVPRGTRRRGWVAQILANVGHHLGIGPRAGWALSACYR